MNDPTRGSAGNFFFIFMGFLRLYGAGRFSVCEDGRFPGTFMPLPA